jgi:NAD+ diphosphatase
MMIQDIGNCCFDNSYRDIEPEPQDYCLFFVNDKIFAKYDEEKKTLYFPHCMNTDAESIYLFSVNEDRYFLEEGDAEGFDMFSMRELMSLDLNENKEIFIAFSAYHLYRWYRSSRYCGCCGEKMKDSRKERAMVCPKCGNTIYPRINPAVIVGVKNEDQLLLTKYRNGYSYNALVAGFAEFGETLEETVAREVKEETGLCVKNIRYYKSQPWGIAQDLLAGFYCEVDGDDTISMDENELRYASWVKRRDIVLQPKRYSLTNEMMERFKNGLE